MKSTDDIFDEEFIISLHNEPQLVREDLYADWKDISQSLFSGINIKHYVESIEKSPKNISKLIDSVDERMILFSGAMHTDVFSEEYNLLDKFKERFINQPRSLKVYAGPEIMKPKENSLWQFLKQCVEDNISNVSYFWTPTRLPIHATIVDKKYFMFEIYYKEEHRTRAKVSFSEPQFAEQVIFANNENEAIRERIIFEPPCEKIIEKFFVEYGNAVEKYSAPGNEIRLDIIPVYGEKMNKYYKDLGFEMASKALLEPWGGIDIRKYFKEKRSS